MKQIGKWLDYLRDNECYDNTRIIIVSDHGYELDSGVLFSEQSQFLPLLLVKDFDSSDELRYDYTFMTNADTILLSINGLDEVSDINPYTGNVLTSEKEDGVNVYPIVDEVEWNAPKITTYTKFTLDDSISWHVRNDIFDTSNWIPLNQWKIEEGK